MSDKPTIGRIEFGPACPQHQADEIEARIEAASNAGSRS